ncbi:MAG: serine/threonine-protein kinase [Desulfohalobiaceae bacterium]
MARILLQIDNRLKLLQKDLPIPDYQHLLPVYGSPELEESLRSLERIHDRDKDQEDSLEQRYELQGAIAHGGMASVFKAVRRADHREVAIKFLSQRYSAKAGIQARFEREYQLLSRLEHPNIIEVFDFGADKGRGFIVMQYIAGGDLASHVHQPLDIDCLLRIFQEVCSGLQSVHEQGIVHRDIKPQNILLDNSGDKLVPKLTDFGLATAPDQQGLTRPDLRLGTLEYSAPEQLSNPAHVGPASDIYSLGASMYYVLSGGNLPSGDYARLEELQKGLPGRLHEVVEKALAKRPADRWSSAQELGAVIAEIREIWAGEQAAGGGS